MREKRSGRAKKLSFKRGETVGLSRRPLYWNRRIVFKVTSLKLIS